MEAQEAQVAQRDRELVEALLSAGTYDLTEEPETPDEDPGDQRTRELAWRNAHNAFLREVRRLRAENATLTADNWRLRARKAAARTLVRLVLDEEAEELCRRDCHDALVAWLAEGGDGDA